LVGGESDRYFLNKKDLVLSYNTALEVKLEAIKPPTKYLNYAIISAWKKEMQEH
jgi:hypothetical protein